MILPFIGFALAGLPPPAHLRDADPDRDVFHALHPAGGVGPPPPPSTPEEASSWDITQYTAHVRVDPVDESLVGTMTIEATRNATLPAGDLLFHYLGGALGTVTVDGVNVTPTSDGTAWHVTPGGDSAEVVVQWQRTGTDADLGIQFSPGVTWSVDEPNGARNWLPVYDEPWDKALWTWEIEAPSTLVVAANGNLTDLVEAPSAADGRAFRTWTWVFDQPIATYLVALHISDYQRFEVGRDIPITVWASPLIAAQTQRAFANTPDMMDLLSADFGAYPWDHYGMATVPFAGAMEHTTCTSFGDVFTVTPDLVNIHELAHHWFGDDVTIADWRDLWLNEGFASYSEALWYESLYGQAGLTEYLSWQRDTYYEWKGEEGDFALYDPTNYFGGTVYEKGSWVVHMLRGILGDDAFFAAMRDYVAKYSYANASTSEFEASIEASTGEDLSWFFDYYVYGTGEPTLKFAWVADGDTVYTAVEADTTMPLPIPVRYSFADGNSVDVKVTLNDGVACGSRTFGARPTDVALDPDLWVLTKDRQVLPQEALAACVASLQSGGDTADSGTNKPVDRPGSYVGATGCGCGTGTGGSGSLVVLALGAMLGRRRR